MTSTYPRLPHHGAHALRRLGALACAALTALAAGTSRAAGDPRTPQTAAIATALETLRSGSGDPELGAIGEPGRGEIEVVVWLSSPSVANARAADPSLDMPAWRDRLRGEQDRFLSRWTAQMPVRVVARVQMVMNAVVLRVDPTALPRLQTDADVQKITLAGRYTLDLPDVVPYIGATALRAAMPGLDGRGVRVAVLDSGIDYTHTAFGGPGTREAYLAAVADPAVADGFPTPKIVAGFDFTGPDFPDGPIQSDPDPIDRNGHGTHVADIIGGKLGVAPGTTLLAIKVCAETAGQCSGPAIMQGIELAVDPNGDGNPDDAVDLINLSLGGDFGRVDDNAEIASIEGATRLGVLTVAAAGNAGDQPFILSAPAAAPSAIAVAQTQVPSATRPQAEVTPADGDTLVVAAEFPRFALRLANPIQGRVQFGDGRGGARDGCDVPMPGGANPFPPDSVRGKLVLVDRGRCAFEEKVKNIEEAGGLLAIIGLVAPGEPIQAAGMIQSSIPAAVIDQASADLLRQGDGEIRIDPAERLPLVQSVVASSSRGPQLDSDDLKPEIGAPGAAVSAQAGTGTGTSRFGGTSGATPVIVGSAALLIQQRPDETPLQIKARLIENAETQIDNKVPGEPAAVSRIGGGEVRVDRASRATALVMEEETQQAKLSFGFLDVSERAALEKTLVVRNTSDAPLVFEPRITFRAQDDLASGALRFSTRPRQLSVPAGESRELRVRMEIDAAKLPASQIDSGMRGNDPAALDVLEFDGYLELAAGERLLHVPWNVLPRRAAELSSSRKSLDAERADPLQVALRNSGAGTAQNDAFALVALRTEDTVAGGRAVGSAVALQAVGLRTTDMDPSVCSSGFALEFAFNTRERQPSLIRQRFTVRLDTNRDGTDDFTVSSGSASALATPPSTGDPRQLSLVGDLAKRDPMTMQLPLSSRFFAENADQTANTVLRACGEQLGLSAADRATRLVRMSFEARSPLGGNVSRLGEIAIAPGAEGLRASAPDLAQGERGMLEVMRTPQPQGSSAPLGVLLFANGARPESSGGATAATEAIVLRLR